MQRTRYPAPSPANDRRHLASPPVRFPALRRSACSKPSDRNPSTGVGVGSAAATSVGPSVRRQAPGVGFAPGRLVVAAIQGPGAWRVVRPLAGLVAGWAGWSAGLWPVAGSAGGVFAGWRLVRRQWPNSPSSGGRSPGCGATGCVVGPRTPFGGVTAGWRCGWWGPRTPCGDLGHQVGTWDRSCRVRGRDLVSEPALCAPVERPGRRDLLRWCTKCRFRESRLPSGQGNTPNFRARQLPECPGKQLPEPPGEATPRTSGRGNSPNVWAQELPAPCRHTPQRLRDSCVPSLVGVVWVKSRNLFPSRRDAKRS